MADPQHGLVPARYYSAEIMSRIIGSLKPPQYPCEHTKCKNKNPSYPYSKVFHCVNCGNNYCEECWEHVEPHKNQKSVNPHRKGDPGLAELLTEILNTPSRPSEEHEKLHQDDARSLWFGLMNKDGKQFIHEGPVYEDLIFENPAVQPWGIFPGLITFVGETGAGKSALIKLLIDVRVQEVDKSTNFEPRSYIRSILRNSRARRSTPIVGSPDNEITPTSADVHLYADSRSLDVTDPGNRLILYADCEGLRGGEQDPFALECSSKDNGHEHNWEQQFLESADVFTPKQITWADSERQLVVESLYPRLLYSFSDVVVYVERNTRVLETVIVNLIAWAHDAIAKSCNQSVLPHAVIVLNMDTFQAANESSRWDPKSVLGDVLKAADKVLHKKASLKDKVKFWTDRNVQINTIQDLLKCYYASIKAIRIPELRYPELLEQQVSRLHNIISSECRDSQEQRRKHRMELDAVKLHLYLRNAFEHFANNLDTPFDFVKASFDINPISPKFGLSDKIVRLAVTVQPLLQSPSILSVWQHIERVLASYFMLNAYKRKVKGLNNPDAIFKQYWPSCKRAIEDFYMFHWPCEYVNERIKRCENVKNSHTSKGHQSKSGEMEHGAWKCSQTIEMVQDTVNMGIKEEIKKVAAEFDQQRKDNDGEEDTLRRVFQCHNKILNKLYSRHEDLSLSSHSTCFSCLMATPEHVLPCHHILCTDCIAAMGTSLGAGFFELKGCPWKHCKDATFKTAYLASIKPEQAGTRILTLDGGGIRGIVELTILKKIEEAMGSKVPIQAFFDLIVGTSTGGIIALGIGQNGWSISKSIEKFKDLSKEAFTSDQQRRKMYRRLKCHGKYSDFTLEEAFRKAFSDDILFGSPSAPQTVQTKVALVTTAHQGPVTVLSNYNRKATNSHSYKWLRAEGPSGEIKTWESARATSAAPWYFREFNHDLSQQTYLDGGIYHNNPIRIADAEAKRIWPQSEYRHPDILLSIGTGFHKKEILPTDAPYSPTSCGIISYAKFGWHLSNDIIKNTLACERAWKDWIETKSPPSEHSSRYRRLNVLLDFEPEMDRVKELDMYASLAERYMDQEREQVNSIANQLIASCFYFVFDKNHLVEDDQGVWMCTGRIECRLSPGSLTSKNFGQLLKQLSDDIKKERSDGICFSVSETHIRSPGSESRHNVPEHVIKKMQESGEFNMGPITISISSSIAETRILMLLQAREGGLVPIGGFPRNLLKDYPDTYRTRKQPQRSSDEDILDFLVRLLLWDQGKRSTGGSDHITEDGESRLLDEFDERTDVDHNFGTENKA